MATVSITIPDNQVARVREAWDATFDREDGESDADFFRRTVAGWVKENVVAYEANRDADAARTSAKDTAESEVSVS